MKYTEYQSADDLNYIRDLRYWLDKHGVDVNAAAANHSDARRFNFEQFAADVYEVAESTGQTYASITDIERAGGFNARGWLKASIASYFPGARVPMLPSHVDDLDSYRAELGYPAFLEAVKAVDVLMRDKGVLVPSAALWQAVEDFLTNGRGDFVNLGVKRWQTSIRAQTMGELGDIAAAYASDPSYRWEGERLDANEGTGLGDGGYWG